MLLGAASLFALSVLTCLVLAAFIHLGMNAPPTPPRPATSRPDPSQRIR